MFHLLTLTDGTSLESATDCCSAGALGRSQEGTGANLDARGNRVRLPRPCDRDPALPQLLLLR